MADANVILSIIYQHSLYYLIITIITLIMSVFFGFFSLISLLMADANAVHITNLTTLLNNKDTRINELEQNVHTLESAIDCQEQYSRRQNLRINGIQETGESEDVTTTVLNLVNTTMAIKPQLQHHIIVKCHRLGPKVDRRGDQQTRPIIVKFSNESIRDDVLRALCQPMQNILAELGSRVHTKCFQRFWYV